MAAKQINMTITASPKAAIAGVRRSVLLPMVVYFCIALGVTIFMLWLYEPLAHAPFLDWDDDRNISANPYYLTGMWKELLRQGYYGLYIPLTSAVWAGLYYWRNGAPEPFRLFNLAMHLLNSAMLLLVLRRLWKVRGSAYLASFVSLLVFAFHPLQVATVAWISGGRDLLAAFWSLLAVLLYFQSSHRSAMKGLATLCFALALLSKPNAAALPLVIALWLWVFEGKGDFVPKVKKLWPSFGLMALWSCFTLGAAYMTYLNQAQAVPKRVPVWFQPIVMLDSFGFLLSQIVWPWPLTADHGRRPDILWNDPSMMIPTLIILAIVIGILVYYQRRSYWAGAFWGWFLLLLPVSGIVPFAFQEISTVADHYHYLPLAFVAGLVFWFVQGIEKQAPWKKGVVIVVAMLGLSVSSWVSQQRIDVWTSNVKFFTAMDQENGQSYSAAIGLGNRACYEFQKFENGLQWFDKALAMRPFDPVATANKIYCLFQMQRFTDIMQFETQLTNPLFVEKLRKHELAALSFVASLGATAARLGDLEKGFNFSCVALNSNPRELAYAKNVETIKNELWKEKNLRVDCLPGKTVREFFSEVAQNIEQSSLTK